MDQADFELEASRASRTLPIVGLILTTIWIAGVLAYAWVKRGDFSNLEPNAVGDFAAGAFAPLAFLWLVLGFFQQGQELRHSGRALWLQGRELQHSVEQQRELVNVTREQLQFESEMVQQQREETGRNSKPILILNQGGNSPGGQGTRVYRFYCKNHGKPCTGVTVDVEGYVRATRDLLPTGQSLDFELELPVGEVEPFKVAISYLDERLLPGSRTFMVTGSNSRFKISEGEGANG